MYKIKKKSESQLIMEKNNKLMLKMDRERERRRKFYEAKKSKEITSEADVLNKIEMRVRKKKPVSDRELRLLAESYEAFGVPRNKRVKLPY